MYRDNLRWENRRKYTFNFGEQTNERETETQHVFLTSALIPNFKSHVD